MFETIITFVVILLSVIGIGYRKAESENVDAETAPIWATVLYYSFFASMILGGALFIALAMNLANFIN